MLALSDCWSELGLVAQMNAREPSATNSPAREHDIEAEASTIPVSEGRGPLLSTGEQETEARSSPAYLKLINVVEHNETSHDLSWNVERWGIADVMIYPEGSNRNNIMFASAFLRGRGSRGGDWRGKGPWHRRTRTRVQKHQGEKQDVREDEAHPRNSPPEAQTGQRVRAIELLPPDPRGSPARGYHMAGALGLDYRILPWNATRYSLTAIHVSPRRVWEEIVDLLLVF
ncbi:unnamed protein product [Amoebophrya sp. A25]|nr:unnamed protein product [Amoebophrya sp. A25]|eukprot:GSA25T00013803001.1